MGTKGETISPRSRARQPVILAMALVAWLVLALAIDRLAGGSPGTGTESPITWSIQQHGPQAHIAGMHRAHRRRVDTSSEARCMSMPVRRSGDLAVPVRHPADWAVRRTDGLMGDP